MTTRTPILLLAGLLMGLLPNVASATTVQRLSLSELTYVADLVVEATVVANSVERKPGFKFLQTVSTLELTHVLKGTADIGQEVDVVGLGGKLGSEYTELPGAARFVPDERVLVFLEWKHGEWRTIGAAQAKYSIVVEPGTGRDVAVKVQPPNGLERFDEAQVQLPAAVTYMDSLVGQILDEVESGYVPPYVNIAGLEPDKDARYRSDARAWGHDVDPRWDTAEHNTSIRVALARAKARAQLPTEVVR